jgi:hypothetical protein
MPQTLLLPIFPADATPINDLIWFCKRDGAVYFFRLCAGICGKGCYWLFGEGVLVPVDSVVSTSEEDEYAGARLHPIVGMARLSGVSV